MTWQDAVLAVGQLLFVVALIPALSGPEKPPVATSFITGATLLAFAGTFASLSLWYGAGMTLLCAACWLTLALQRVKDEL